MPAALQAVPFSLDAPEPRSILHRSEGKYVRPLGLESSFQHEADREAGHSVPSESGSSAKISEGDMVSPQGDLGGASIVSWLDCLDDDQDNASRAP